MQGIVKMPAPGSPLHVNRIDEVTVVTFRDRILLDTEELKIIEDELIGMAREKPGFRLVIDFHNVQTLSSQMLGALLKVGEQLKTTQGQLGLCNLNGKIKEAFEITNLKKVFKIYDSQSAAIKTVR